MLSYVFFPFAYLIGITNDPVETFIVARLLGVKLVVNDFIAYKRLGDVLAQGLLSVRSKIKIF
jgi:nucleoside permease NupC